MTKSAPSIEPAGAPRVSVVVPVWNSPAQVLECLAALRAQTYPADRFEVLVVDNGSTDGTAQTVRDAGFGTLLSEPQPGSYAARNRGLAAARGEFVAFTDADCRPAPDWLESAVRAAEGAPGFGVLAGRVDLFRPDDQASEACMNYERLFAFRQHENARQGHCVTANWMSRREVLTAMDGFNPAATSGGDWDLSGRIRAAGHPLIYVDDMVVAHPARRSFRELAAKRRRVMGGHWTQNIGPLRAARVLAGTLGRGARKVGVALSARQLDWGERLAVAGIAAALPLVASFEFGRLALGGRRKRA